MGLKVLLGLKVMSFQVGIGSLSGTVFFQVGLCTPLQTMCHISSVLRVGAWLPMPLKNFPQTYPLGNNFLLHPNDFI